MLAAECDNLSLILEPTWWKERTNSPAVFGNLLIFMCFLFPGVGLPLFIDLATDRSMSSFAFRLWPCVTEVGVDIFPIAGVLVARFL